VKIVKDCVQRSLQQGEGYKKGAKRCGRNKFATTAGRGGIKKAKTAVDLCTWPLKGTLHLPET